MKNLILALLIVCPTFIFAQEFSSKGTTFWFAYMENLDLLFNGGPQFSVYVSSNTAGNATVSAPATGLNLDFAYAANEVTEYILPPSIFYAFGSESIENFGLRITTDTPVNVFVVHHRLYFTETSIVLPEEIIGSEYLVSAALDEGNDASSPSSFVVVATIDNTEVEIIPSALTLGIRPEDVAFSITLDAGQSYQVQSLGDLTGSSVRSINGEKIAVFGGARQANIGCGFNADNHLYDQLYPTSAAGTEYALIPFKDQGTSVFKVLALEDNTEVVTNGTVTEILDKGDYFDFTLTTPLILSSTKNVFVTQFNPSQECSQSLIGDPNMLQLTPIGYKTKISHFQNLEGFGNTISFTKRYITLFTDTEDIDDITLNGALVQFDPFPSFPEYSYKQIELSSGSSTILAPGGVTAHAYGFGEFDAYTYHLGFDKADISSTSNELEFLDYRIMPNPVSDNLYFTGTDKIEQIQLLDMNGRVLNQLDVIGNSFTIDVAGLSAGVYLIKIRSGNKFVTEKIVKL